MKQIIFAILFLTFHLGFSQQYDSLVFEKENIDSNNKIFTPENIFIFDYEIIQNGKKFKLKKNKGMFAGREFELTSIEKDSIAVKYIHLITQNIDESEKTNKNQTEISYIQEPFFSSISSTGVVENEQNVWIHPIRDGFFNSLETCPFPYVKKPLKIGLEWKDAMIIGQGWRGEKWGEWNGQLLLNYNYKITGKELVKTSVGLIECFIIESIASSKIGKTKLKTYFSDIFGFVRLEYELITKIKVNMWLIDFKKGQKFNNAREYLRTIATK